MVKETLYKFGSVDVLINNAGVALQGLITETDEIDFDNKIHIQSEVCLKKIQNVFNAKIKFNENDNEIYIVALHHSKMEFFVYDITKQELSRKWKKSEAYIYRRFSEEVEFSLTDIIELISILKISKEEAIDIFFN